MDQKLVLLTFAAYCYRSPFFLPSPAPSEWQWDSCSCVTRIVFQGTFLWILKVFRREHFHALGA